MTEYKIIRLVDMPKIKDAAARWFHEKWGVPLTAYIDSIDECLRGDSHVPQWYLALSRERIIGGLGVIENDFHERVDLSPNVCAVFVEEDMRGQGIAGELLDVACRDMSWRGVDTLYLATDHTSFYERHGWEFFCLAKETGSDKYTRLYIHKCNV